MLVSPDLYFLHNNRIINKYGPQWSNLCHHTCTFKTDFHFISAYYYLRFENLYTFSTTVALLYIVYIISYLPFYTPSSEIDMRYYFTNIETQTERKYFSKVTNFVAEAKLPSKSSDFG